MGEERVQGMKSDRGRGGQWIDLVGWRVTRGEERFGGVESSRRWRRGFRGASKRRLVRRASDHSLVNYKIYYRFDFLY